MEGNGPCQNYKRVEGTTAEACIDTVPMEVCTFRLQCDVPRADGRLS